MIQSYKELIVWQKAILLCEKIYILTENFPKAESFGLVSQMRRSAVSIPSNIAEGKYRGTRKDFTQFLRIARGSTAELETQILIAKKFYSLDTSTITDIEKLLEEISKMLSSVIKKLQAVS